jgi:integrase
VPINLQLLEDASHELRQRRVTGKPKQRQRRVTADEEKALLDHFDVRDVRAEIPMADIIRFALLTARRQEEITRLKWADLDRDKGIAWLDDVKHPRKKIGNRRAFRLLSEAWEIIDRQPRPEKTERVFPYNPKSIGANFTRACRLRGLDDLHFHDLRHEATSRLFERGYDIPEVAHFTLHESWTTLKRYTHLRPEQVEERPAKAPL